MFDFLKGIQNSPFPTTQCCAKPEKAIPDHADQEWASKLATNIE